MGGACDGAAGCNSLQEVSLATYRTWRCDAHLVGGVDRREGALEGRRRAVRFVVSAQQIVLAVLHGSRGGRAIAGLCEDIGVVT